MKKKVFKGWMYKDAIPVWTGKGKFRQIVPPVYKIRGKKGKDWQEEFWPPRKVTVTFEWEE